MKRLIAFLAVVLLAGLLAPLPAATARPPAKFKSSIKIIDLQPGQVTLQVMCRKGRNSRISFDATQKGGYNSSTDLRDFTCTGKPQVFTWSLFVNQEIPGRYHDLVHRGYAKVLISLADVGTYRWNKVKVNQPLVLGRYADVYSQGTRVKWTVNIICPREKTYILDALVADLDTDAPHDDGGDRGVRATTSTRGKCSGKAQDVRLTLDVQAEEWFNSQTGRTEYLLWPMNENGGNANVWAVVRGNGFSFSACVHAACASTTQNWYPQLT